MDHFIEKVVLLIFAQDGYYLLYFLCLLGIHIPAILYVEELLRLGSRLPYERKFPFIFVSANCLKY